MAEVGRKRSLDGDDAGPFARKKMKLSDLPLTQSQRSAIDNLVHTFRKKGEYDAIKSLVRSQFETDGAKAALLSSLEELIDRETDRNPSLLSKDPKIAASLLEGAGERSDIYKPVHTTIADLVSQFMETQGIAKMREYRAMEAGEEVAAEEEKRGSKSEEDWAREADARRQERATVREEELEKEREREREEKAKKEERRRREREEDEAREKARQEREERRRKEREDREREEEERRRQDRERIEREKEERRARRKREDEEREAEREARLQRIRDEDRERERRFALERNRSRERHRGSRARSRTPDRDRDRDRDRGRRRTRTRSPEPVKDVKLEDIKVDDDLALQALLQESEQMKKSRQRPVLERSESLEPPSRKAQPPKSLVPRDPVAARLAALESKPQSPAIQSPSKLDTKSITSPAAATPSSIKDEDTLMEDAPPIKSTETGSRSRWDRPPPSRSDEKSRRSRSRSIARSVSIRKRSRSRSRSRGSRYDRRSSRIDDDRRSRRDDDRYSYRARDDRDDRRLRRDDRDSRYTRSPSRETTSRRKSRYESRSPSPYDRRRDRDRDRRRSRSRSREGRRGRDRTPPPRRRHRTRSRSPDGIDRYVPGGGGGGGGSGGAVRKRDGSRDRSYRSREYDRWDGDRGGRSRLQDSDRYLPGREKPDDDRDRDRVRDRDRDRDVDRDRDRDRDRRRRSRTRSRSRRRSTSRSRRR